MTCLARWGFLTFSLLVFSATADAQAPHARSVRDIQLPDSRGVFQLLVPESAKINVNGRDYEDRSYFQFSNLRVGKRYEAKIQVLLESGETVKRSLFIKGGTYVLWPVPLPEAARPVLLSSAGHLQPIVSVAVSRDGKQMLTGSLDRSAILWDVETGVRARVFADHSQPISCAAFSPDGMKAVLGTGLGPIVAGRASVWNLESGEKELDLQGPQGGITAVVYSSNGETIAAACEDGKAYVWTAAGELKHTLAGHEDALTSLAFASEDAVLVTGSKDGSAATWNLETGEQAHKLQPDAGSVHAVGFISQQQEIITGGDDRRITFWDLETGAEKRRSDVLPDGINTLAVDGNGKRIFLGTRNRHALAADAQTGKPLWALDCGALGEVSAVPLADGRVITRSGSGLEPSEVVLWDAASGRRLRRFGQATRPITAAQFSRDGSRILIASGDAGIFEAGVQSRVVSNPVRPFAAAALSGDGKNVLTASNSLRLWNASNGQGTRVIEGIDFPRVAVVSRFSATAVTVSSSSLATLWDLNDGRALRTYAGHSGVSSAAFSPSGRWTLTGGGEDGIAMLWDSRDGRRLRTFRGHETGVTAVAISSDARHALTGAEDGLGLLWDIRAGRSVRRLEGHEAAISAVAFSPDLGFMATADVAGEIILWDMNRDQRLSNLAGDGTAITTLSVGPRGRYLLAGGADGAVRLWDVFSGEDVARVRLRESALRGQVQHQERQDHRTAAVDEQDDGEDPDLPRQ
ncbi:MAG: PQQ-binding-like beta-propeller repeat protein, partial [Planctomycetales bacterium]